MARNIWHAILVILEASSLVQPPRLVLAALPVHPSRRALQNVSAA